VRQAVAAHSAAHRRRRSGERALTVSVKLFVLAVFVPACVYGWVWVYAYRRVVSAPFFKCECLQQMVVLLICFAQPY